MNCSLIGGTTLTIRQESKTPIVHGQMKMPNANLQVIELNPRCSGQAYFKGPRTGPANENTVYECTFKSTLFTHVKLREKYICEGNKNR